MNTKHAATSLLFSVAALVLSACSDPRQEPAPKTAVIDEVRSLDDAKTRFLEGIDWQSRPAARATLYRDLLKRNDTVGESETDVARRASDFEWFALVDYEPGAYFRHPVSYAFLTYADPTISLVEGKQLPVLNYRPMWQSVADLLADPNVIYAQSWIDKAPPRSAADSPALQPENWPPRMSVDQCKNEKRAYGLLLHNLPDLSSSPETEENLEMMAAALTASGYYVQTFTQGPKTDERRPYINLAAPQGHGIYQLVNFLNVHVDFNDCCEEIIVYLTGETSLEKDGRRSLASFDLPFGYGGASGKRAPARSFHPEDLAQILDGLKTCHLNVIVDANNAEGFSGDLLRVPTTESVLTSCQENEYTYSSAVASLVAGETRDRRETEFGERGSVFTSSVAMGIFEQSKLRSDDDAPLASAKLLEAAFELVKRRDLAYLAGKTTPHLRGRALPSGCPCGIDELAAR